MSADAKAWVDETGAWNVCHDGPCTEGQPHTPTTEYCLTSLLTSVENCMKQPLRWSFRRYPNNKIGLVGYL